MSSVANTTIGPCKELSLIHQESPKWSASRNCCLNYEPAFPYGTELRIVKKTIFEIESRFPGTLAITPRPRGGDWLEVDIAALSFQGVNVLVSLLEAEEAFELGLEGESASCAIHGIEFLTLPVPDLGIPVDSTKFVQAATDLAGVLRKGKCIAIHCRQSVGRSGLLAASIAVAAGLGGLTDAIEAVSEARGVRVPETPAQLEWLRRYEPHLSAGKNNA